MALLLTLADVLSFVGLAGTAIAIASALVASIAFSVGAPESGWIAVVGWLAGLLLSLGNSFAGYWTLLLLPLISMPVALALTVIIAALRNVPRRRSTGASRPIPSARKRARTDA